jgi:TetR/AcrR family transcriptional regulator
MGTRKTGSGKGTRVRDAARPRGRPRAQAADDVRAHLLAAARELFLKYGYRAVSSRQVAAAAGANPAMIHYYFGNKHGLFHAMIEQAIAPAIAQLNAMLDAPAASASTARMLETYMGIVAANPWIPGLLLREVFAPDAPYRSRFISDFGSKFAPRIADLVEREARAGHVRGDVDPKLAVVSFLSLGLFPFLALPVWTRALGVKGSRGEIARLIEHTARVFREGVHA